jgi:hypothetical protein
MLKIAVSLLAFAAVLTLSVQSLANEGAGHEAAKHGGGEHKAPLFPQPVADKSKVALPGTPELVEPAFMTKVTGAAVTLKWNSVIGADFYTVQVATDPNFKWLVTADPLHKTTTFEVKGLEAGKHYYWRVFAGKSDNDATYTKSLAAKSMFETN